MILVIDNYDSFTFNLVQYLEELGAKTRVIRNDALTLKAIEKLKPQKIVISPGPGHPGESGVCLEVIEKLGPKIPILGVCLGHQAIGQVYGGRVIRAAKQRHGKISELRHKGKGVFKGLPPVISVTRYHSLIVDEKTLPFCLEITARVANGVDKGLIMGLRHKKFPVEGVQFHPESIMTLEGKKMLANFLKERAR